MNQWHKLCLHWWKLTVYALNLTQEITARSEMKSLMQYLDQPAKSGLEIATNTVANATNFSSLATKIVV